MKSLTTPIEIYLDMQTSAKGGPWIKMKDDQIYIKTTDGLSERLRCM